MQEANKPDSVTSVVAYKVVDHLSMPHPCASPSRLITALSWVAAGRIARFILLPWLALWVKDRLCCSQTASIRCLSTAPFEAVALALSRRRLPSVPLLCAVRTFLFCVATKATNQLPAGKILARYDIITSCLSRSTLKNSIYFRNPQEKC